MRSRPVVTAATYALLGGVASVTFLLPGALTIPSILAADGQDRLTLDGTVRGFTAAHADFDVDVIDGYGHYAATVRSDLTPDGRPALAPAVDATTSGDADRRPSCGGFRVDAPWRDTAGNAIAPHLADVGARGPRLFDVDGIAVRGRARLGHGARIEGASGLTATLVSNGTGAGLIELGDEAVVDGLIELGPGAEPNTVISASESALISGTVDVRPTAYPLPRLERPRGLGPGTGSMRLIDGDTTVIGSDLHLEHLVITRGSRIEIDGHVTIFCERDTRVGRGCQIDLRPRSSLTLYVGGSLRIARDATLNATTRDHALVRVLVLAASGVGVGVDSAAGVYASVAAPTAMLRLGPGARFDGNFVGGSLLMDEKSVFTCLPAPTPKDACGTAIADAPGRRGAPGSGGITNAATFGAWFRDVPGVNTTQSCTLALLRGRTGVWSFLDDDFHPISGARRGNEGGGVGDFFTYHVRATFQYRQCWAQFLEVAGGDGLWVFIDGRLVIDLGGIGAPDAQYLALDRLGLTHGQTYTLDLFYAQRQSSSAVFRLRTTLDLRTPGATAVFTDAEP